jgi:hypothetical protein
MNTTNTKTHKFSWGTGIAIVIVLACMGIIFMVYKATTYNFEMVANDYYEKELTYNDQLAAIANAKKIGDSLTIMSQKDFLLIQFPAMPQQAIQGTVTLYCVTDAQKDIVRKIALNDQGIMLFEQSLLIASSYKAIAEFTSNGKNYYFEQSFINK